MYKIKSGLFCARGYLTRKTLRNSTSLVGFKIFNGSDVKNSESFFTKCSNIWLKPAARFYTEDSKIEKEPVKPEDKLDKNKITEGPINLTSEQIKALFYTKVAEPIALISQDKYYFSFQEKNKESLKTEPAIIKSNVPKPNISKISDGVKISKQVNITNIPQDLRIDNVINAQENVRNSVCGEINSANVINSLIEKELGTDGGTFGGTPAKEGVDSNKSSWLAIKYAFFVFGTAIVGAIVGIVMFVGAPRIDDDDELVVDKYSEMPVVVQYVFRTIEEFHNFNKLIKDPSRDKLLPDVLTAPYYQPPYTLVLEFTDLLVHPEWTYSTGWRFKKRPGLDQFLETLYTRYEVVVYTAEMGMTVFPIIETLDKNNLISYKLVRDATKFMDGHHVKDLEKLNRDLSKVIVIDWNSESTKLHKDNLFRIPRWSGNDDDTTLYDLTALLMAISEWKVEDVRSVLTYYSEFEDPLGSFKERQRILATQNL